MAACYLELYEEGEVGHINSPTHPPSLVMNSGKLLKGRSVGLIVGLYIYFFWKEL